MVGQGPPYDYVMQKNQIAPKPITTPTPAIAAITLPRHVSE
jgi:hypothetical protein